eukprot:CAMPEP_0172785692 /NCGR_PEP_ID=MMETSP1074-20121228/205573_1 /TAXON_ID=2916 /ORGANISM="Ceratium fusus, Strain PA161109" /LENGTH=52 /DNA_ID=CAMNT_0013622703 /DNA_START=989 /DNA_END=1147 /DNA_ORIENTATION=-
MGNDPKATAFLSPLPALRMEFCPHAIPPAVENTDQSCTGKKHRAARKAEADK